MHHIPMTTDVGAAKIRPVVCSLCVHRVIHSCTIAFHCPSHAAMPTTPNRNQQTNKGCPLRLQQCGHIHNKVPRRLSIGRRRRRRRHSFVDRSVFGELCAVRRSIAWLQAAAVDERRRRTTNDERRRTTTNDDERRRTTTTNDNERQRTTNDDDERRRRTTTNDEDKK